MATFFAAAALAVASLAAKPAPAQPMATSASAAPTVTLQPNMFGVNVSGWDPWMLQPSGVAATQQLGIGIEQFPNSPWIYNWHTNQSLVNGHWYPIPVSLSAWATSLQQAGTHGLYIVPYGFNPTATGGETVADVVDLVRTILAHHWPISAMVIGSEEYGSWAAAANLRQSHSAVEYATVAAKMADAIHAVDPAMQVGVDFDLPWNVTAPEPQDLAWDRTVLQIAGPHVNFLSVHAYPISTVASNRSLLQALAADIPADMAFVHRLMASALPAGAAAPQVWITEFNPYTVQSLQSTQPVMGAALIESYLTWFLNGASQVDWWSLYGDAHTIEAVGGTNQNTPLASPDATAFATNGLLSEGQAPQPSPANRLYPSGQAYAALTAVVRAAGGPVQVQALPALYTHYHLFAARLTGGNGTWWALVNAAGHPVSLTLESHQLTLASGQWRIVAASATGAPPTVTDPTTVAPPAITQAWWNPMTATVTVLGSNLGPAPATVPACGSGSDQPVVAISDPASGAQYGWYSPGGNRDCYGITVLSWQPGRIRLQLQGPLPAAGSVLTVRWWQALGPLQVPLARIAAAPRRPAWWPTGSRITSAAYDPQTATLTLTGSNLGTAPPLVPASGGGDDQAVVAVADPADSLQWGFAQPGVNTDAFGLRVLSWTPSTIRLQLTHPPGANGQLTVDWLPSGQTVTTPAHPAS